MRSGHRAARFPALARNHCGIIQLGMSGGKRQPQSTYQVIRKPTLSAWLSVPPPTSPSYEAKSEVRSLIGAAAEKPTTALSRCGVAPKTVNWRPGAAANAAVIGRPCRRIRASSPAARRCRAAGRHPGRSWRRSRRRGWCAPRSWSATGTRGCRGRAAFAEARLGARSDLHAAERGDRRLRRAVEAELVAGLELAEELVGAGVAVGEAGRQAGRRPRAACGCRVGVARKRIGVEAALVNEP